MNRWPGLAIAAGSFLLFLVQPVLGKLLLPEHGGSAGVWTACLLFFQLLLVAGYSWAHFARPKWHLALLGVSLLWLPLRDYPGLFSSPPLVPEFGIILALAVSASLPYIALAANSSLVQRWSGAASPYRLYALSNAGSLAALLTYPVLIEPWLSLRSQRYVWSAGYVLFAAVAALIAWRRARGPAAEQPAAAATLWPEAGDAAGWWLALSACGSALLMAFTNQMCQEIAPIPFLWIAPLVIYLGSFILCFDRPAFYRRGPIAILAGIAIVNACMVNVLGTRLPVAAQLATLALTLFLCLLVCHGELVASRPPASRLTFFYLVVSAGGALGAVLVAVAAPRLFTRFTEFPLLMAATAILGILSRLREGSLTWNAQTPLVERAHLGSLLVAALTCGVLAMPAPVVEASRNFYGTLRVTEGKDSDAAVGGSGSGGSGGGSGLRYRMLTHGATAHGFQYLDGGSEARRIPTAYYGWNTLAGQVLSRQRGRIGLVGLGVGTLARYGEPGDTYRFYELNPEVIRLARQRFTFLADARARVEVIEGDARLRLQKEEETDARFNSLVIDAFSSDSIPVHLLTLEAARLYQQRLVKDGVLLIHISNRMLRLEPVVRAMASEIGFSAWRLDTPGDKSRGGYDAQWMLLARDQAVLERLGVAVPPIRRAPVKPIPWTDDFASVWQVLER